MTLEEVTEMLAVQLPPLGDRAVVAGLWVAPDVWCKLVDHVPLLKEPAVFSWRIIVNPWLPRGVIMPFDAHGKPIPKPRPTQKESK